jgi:hypothetical membrane protein
MIVIDLSVFYFVAVILLAQWLAPGEYRWTQNTVSELASQGVKNQWLMRAGFIGFGMLLTLGYIQKFTGAQRVALPDLLIVAYGLAILLAGFFSAAPYSAGVSYSVRESRLHSLFASVAGVCFSAGIFLQFLAAPTLAERWQHGVFLFLVTGVSLAFGLAENGTLALGKGIVQRILYLVSFAWLLVSQAGRWI